MAGEETRFKPGNSGGPGRKRLDPFVREMLEAATPKAAKALIEALDAIDADGLPAHDVRLRASDAVLNRLYGKPAQAITGEDGGPVQVVTGADLLEALRKLGGRDG